MFAKVTMVLSGSALDAGTVNVPRPSDRLSDRCARRAEEALEFALVPYTASMRGRDRAAYRAQRQGRREALEALLWVEPGQEALPQLLDLVDLICREDCWGETEFLFDDPLHPVIDVDAAETGVLLAWTRRRHGALLQNADSQVCSRIAAEIRRRLIAPILTYDDYDFLRGQGPRPAQILCDIALCCLLTEKSAARRQPPIKLLMHTLDRLCATKVPSMRPFGDKLAEACALGDLARLIKRMTRGEADLTGDVPPSIYTDDVLIPWIDREYFIDPADTGLLPRISGMDFFRLGYFTRDRALCALGAALNRERERPSCSVTGRILSMEYVRAAADEVSAPPRLRRAVTEDGAIMLSRVGGLFAAIHAGSGRGNPGDVLLFAGSTPILIDMGAGSEHSLPIINGYVPGKRMGNVAMDCDFGEDRDLMSADLTLCYPEKSNIAACQRTLMTLRGDRTVRLVDAFEFTAPCARIVFRFVTGQRPIPLPDSVRIGPVTMTWDGDMRPEVYEIQPTEGHGGPGSLIQFVLEAPPQRVLCGFTFEKTM